MRCGKERMGLSRSVHKTKVAHSSTFHFRGLERATDAYHALTSVHPGVCSYSSAELAPAAEPDSSRSRLLPHTAKTFWIGRGR